MSRPNIELTIIYAFYGHWERIEGILKEKHPRTRVIIVDDGYPTPLQKLEGVEVYRIEEDIPWNNPGAKNLGFYVADGWIAYADIDHLYTRTNVDEIINLKKEKGTVYFPGRKDVVTGEELLYWGTYIIHKDDFELIGGYDEDFSGHYGHDDTLFLDQCYKNLKVVEVRNIKIQLYDDSHTKNVVRDASFNQRLLHQKLGTVRNEGKRLNFKWKAL